MRLNLGSGGDLRQGWINVDLYRHADLREDIARLTSIANDSVDEIDAEHCLEHLGRQAGINAIHRWYGVLKPGGKVRIVVPDIAFYIMRWIDKLQAGAPDLWDFPSQCIWGDQGHDGMYHKWGYTENSLTALLKDAGFVDIRLRRMAGLSPGGPIPGANIVAIARKPE